MFHCRAGTSITVTSLYTETHSQIQHKLNVIQSFVKTRQHHRHARKLKFGGKFDLIFFLKNTAWLRIFFCTAIKTSHRLKFLGGCFV
jgi:hypothetical protein